MLAAVLLVSGAAACGPSGGGGAPATYNVVFTLSNTPSSLTGLEFTVAYENGNFSGSGSTVSCTLVDSANDADFDDDNAGVLTVVIDASENNLDDDDDIVECDFVSTVQPTQDNFTITIDDADPEDPEDVDVVVTSTELVGEALVAE